jgi:chemotaxis signal transduction protein
MGITRSADHLYVIALIGHQTYAVPADSVCEMVSMPHVTSIPEGGSYLRGVINLRGSVIPVIDARTRLGMISCVEEAESFISMMHDREADHRNWLQELESSVMEKRRFNLETDPRKCAFGKWYYGYDAHSAANRCMALDLILVKFETPHNVIHGVAEKVLKMQMEGDFEGALMLIERTRKTDLAQMIKLFEEARASIRERGRELAMVVEFNGKKFALAVDAVESVERLNQNVNEISSLQHAGLEDPVIENVAQRAKDDSMVIVLNVSKIAGNAMLNS